jgi:enamine deaminase RidA (YjgF/YER057c/UK114 family)
MKTFTAVTPSQFTAVADAYQFSPAVRHGDILYISGQLGMNEDGSLPTTFEDEVDNVFAAMSLILVETGASLSDITNVVSYHVGDLNEQLSIFTAVKTRHLGKPHPAWTAVGVTQLAVPGLSVEVSAIAHLRTA